jgi:DNA-binding response OmpR family regulator
MEVLIVENGCGLGQLWADHVGRLGCEVVLVHTQTEAEALLRKQDFDVLVINLNLHPRAGDASAIADYASYRRPEAKVVCVTSNSFFSDGSIFRYMPNACAMIPPSTQPSDIAALVEYHGR